jgi:RNA polymerase sigma-70 factor (ECF subfamily)
VRELLEQLSPQVYRYLLWLSGERDTAEELAQETLLSAWRNQNRLREVEKVRVWVLRIALNQWRDHCRRRQTERRHAKLKDCTLTVQQSAELVAEQREDITRTMAAIKALPDRQRDVLYLHACEGLALADISNLLEIAPGAVKSSLSVARKQLRKQLADVYAQLSTERRG